MVEEAIEFGKFVAVGLFVLFVLFGGGITILSFAWDCDAAVERWEAARTSCEASGGHWRGQPIEEFCDGHMMIVPRGECWSDVGVNLDIE